MEQKDTLAALSDGMADAVEKRRRLGRAGERTEAPFWERCGLGAE